MSHLAGRLRRPQSGVRFTEASFYPNRQGPGRGRPHPGLRAELGEEDVLPARARQGLSHAEVDRAPKVACHKQVPARIRSYADAVLVLRVAEPLGPQVGALVVELRDEDIQASCAREL